MERIPQEVIESLLAGTDLVKLISRSVPLKPTDNEQHIGVCPFHRGSESSLHVDAIGARFECSSCRFSGSAVGWLMFYDGMPFQAAINHLGDLAGIDVGRYVSSEELQNALRKQSELLGRVADYYHQQLNDTIAQRYLSEQSMDADTVDEFRIGFARHDKDAADLLKAFPGQGRALWLAGVLIRRQDKSYYPRFQNRVMFPIHSHSGDVVGFGGRSINGYLPKYLNSSSSILFNKSNVVYSSPQLFSESGGDDPVLIVEGYTDVTSVHQELKVKVVGTMGTALTAEHVSYALEISKNVVLCFDGDRAGRDAALKALSRLFNADAMEGEISIIVLPEKHDPDSFIRAHGADAFRELFASAVSAIDYFVDSLSDGLDLTYIGDCARLASIAKPIISAMKQGSLRDQLAKSIDELVGVPLEYDNVAV
ncbi:DNA primase [Maritalea sp.]|uniref:DNA primase n=1 Tax=Maritalea sp. TaxID=2003361 RepID=UPI003EF6B954